MEPRKRRFEEIYSAYSGLILAYAARRLDDPSEAADVVAETFTVAWRRLEDVPAGEHARPWLYGVARRVLANHRRGVRRRRQLDARLVSEAVTAVPATESGESSPDAARLRRALAALSEADRELLTLIGWDGLSPAEAASVLGIAAPAVRVRLHRARRRLAEQLSEADMQRPARPGHEKDRWAMVAHPDPEDS